MSDTMTTDQAMDYASRIVRDHSQDSANSDPLRNLRILLKPKDGAASSDSHDLRKLAKFANKSAPRYPIDALGPLADVAQAIAEGAQVDPAIAGQSVLATAALCTQHRADVETLTGRSPLSLFLLTIGESGCGKTTADKTALRAVKLWEREQVERWKERAETWDETKPTERSTAKPREVYLIARDSTVEGIRRDFAEGRPSQGSFTSEAAAMLGGYGMSKDHRAKTAGTFNAMWDDGELSVSRGMTGRFQLYDRRLSLHWMIQPEAARDALHDPLLSGLGFWPRFLIAWPEPAKPRKARPFRPDQDRRIEAFWNRCEDLFDILPVESCKDLDLIALSNDARVLVGRYFEETERLAKTAGGRFAEVKPFAIRAAEHVCRVAGVLAQFEGKREVSEQDAINAMQLVTYSVHLWRYVFEDRERVEGTADANRLLVWLQTQADGAAESAILRLGPGCTRSRSSRDRALSILEHEGRAAKCGDKWVATDGR